MMNQPLKTLASAGGAALVTWACASSPPRELLDARAVYARLVTTDAPRLNPNAVENARVALAAAQESYVAGMPPYLVRDRSYISIRASELAQVLVASEREQAERKRAWARAAGSAEDVRERLSEAEENLDQTDTRPPEASESVPVSVVDIKDEPRGTVLTVPAQMLFLPGSADFLPGTSDRLKPVAEALREEKDSKIVVDPGSDSGRPHTDLGLCLRRADHVRAFLVSHDVPSERVTVASARESPPPPDRATVRPIVVSLTPAS